MVPAQRVTDFLEQRFSGKIFIYSQNLLYRNFNLELSHFFRDISTTVKLSIRCEVS